MAYKEWLQRVQKRNENIRRYHDKHPKMSQAAIGKVFKVDQSLVSRILSKSNGND